MLFKIFNMNTYGLLVVIPLTLQIVTCNEEQDNNADLPANIFRLTTENFDKLVTGDNSIWLVEFIVPVCGPCDKVVEEFFKAAQALEGIAKIGIVNARQDNEIAARFLVKQYPSFRIISGKEAKFVNGENDAKNLVNAVLDYIREKVKTVIKPTKKDKESDVTELSDQGLEDKVLNSLDPWLVMFYAPWCGHCQNFKPQYKAAAKNMEGKVRFGALDATVYKHLADRYKIKGFPTVKYFPAGRKTLNSAVDYSAGRLAENVVDWLNNRLAEDEPPPAVEQITSKELFDSTCSNKPLCVILFVPHILDCPSVCRNKHVDMMKEISFDLKIRKWGWLWSEAIVQEDLEKSMDLGGFGYPALSVLSPKKLRYSIFRGAYSRKPIRQFLKEIGTPRTSTAPLRGNVIPKINEVAPWDGTDGPEVADTAKEEKSAVKEEL